MYTSLCSMQGDYTNSKNKNVTGVGLMTQLIGAICAGGKKIILLSDRLVSRAGLAFERGSKGDKIADNAMILTAGTVHEPELIEKVKSDLTTVSKPTILSIAEKLSEEHQRIRLTRIKADILRSRGFDSIDDYYSRQRLLHDSTVLDIYSKIEEYDLGSHILLGGVDSRAHLYYIHNPGAYTSFDSIGFFCPGTGKEQAESTFVWYEFTPDLSVHETLYIAFEAKKKAEVAGQVGKTTDAWLVDERGTHEISRETIKELDKIYSSQQEISRFGKEVSELRVP